MQLVVPCVPLSLRPSADHSLRPSVFVTTRKTAPTRNGVPRGAALTLPVP